MKFAILVFHLINTVVLTGLILLQSSHGGLGSAWGGGEMYHSKRGAEQLVFRATIVVALLFLMTSIALLVVR